MAMKKLLCLAALLVAATGMKAQEQAAHQWWVKPMVGGTYSRPAGSGMDNLEYKLGVTAGAEVIYQPPRQEVFSVSGGLLYSQQGYKVNTSSNMTMSLNYLNIPLLMNFRLSDGLTLKIGLQPACLLASNASFKLMGQEMSLDMSDGHETWNLTAPVGLAFNTGAGVVLDFRYYIGLSNIESSEMTLAGQTIQNEGSRGRHNVFMLTLGYQFNL